MFSDKITEQTLTCDVFICFIDEERGKNFSHDFEYNTVLCRSFQPNGPTIIPVIFAKDGPETGWVVASARMYGMLCNFKAAFVQEKNGDGRKNEWHKQIVDGLDEWTAAHLNN